MAKMNLWTVLLPFLRGNDLVELKENTLRLIALGAKNNPEVVDYLVAQGVLAKLIALLESASHELGIIKKLLMAISALCQTKDSPDLDAYMQSRSAALFESLLAKDAEHESLRDQIIFLYLNYTWSHQVIPTCLEQSKVLYPLFDELHYEHCDDPGCNLPIRHRPRPKVDF